MPILKPLAISSLHPLPHPQLAAINFSKSVSLFLFSK